MATINTFARDDANDALSATSLAVASRVWTSGALWALVVWEWSSTVSPAVPTSVAGATMTFSRYTLADVAVSPSANLRISLWVALGNGNTEAVTITAAQTDQVISYDLMHFTLSAGSWATALGALKQAKTGSGLPSANPALTLTSALQDTSSVVLGALATQPSATMTPSATSLSQNYGGFGRTTPISEVPNSASWTNVAGPTASWTLASQNWGGVAVEIAQPTGAVPSGGSSTLTGTQKVASTLTCTTASWTGTPTSYKYTWRRADDSGFTTNVVTIVTDTPGNVLTDTYTLAAADDGKFIDCQVIATNGSGDSTAATSASTAQITYPAPTNSVAPVVSGTPQVGVALTVAPGTWTP